MHADRRESDAAPGAGKDGAGPGDLVRATADSASGALVVLVCGPGAPGDGPSRGAGAAPELAGIEEGALDRFEVRVCRLRAARDPDGGALSVTAVVRAPHRRAAFAAARWALAAARERLAGSGKGEDGTEAPGRTTPGGP